MNAIVFAAGEGRRLRPLTERWPKPILPIDGKPVVGTLLRELASAGVHDVTVVTGHLAERVEALVGDGSAFGVRVRFARQPRQEGSADAVRRAFAAGAALPTVAVAADTVFAPGTIARFIREWGDADGALAPPLWGLGEAVAPFLDDLPGPPYGLQEAFRRAAAAGCEVRTVEIAGTRDLTDPLDLMEQNVPYLT